VGFSVNNIGTGGAAASNAGVYLSSDSTITTSDTPIGSFSAGALTAGQSATASLSVALPSNLAPGTYYMGAVADSGNAIAESNEANNASNAVPVILGNDSANTLNGSSGNDILYGFAGNDTFYGGTGKDLLIGGAGSDHFVYRASTEGLDRIVDFTPGSDVLDFSRSAFGSHLTDRIFGTGPLASSHFVANATGPTNSAQTFWFNTNINDPAHYHTLYFDADGSGPGAPIAMVTLGQAVALTAADIHMV